MEKKGKIAGRIRKEDGEGRIMEGRDKRKSKKQEIGWIKNGGEKGNKEAKKEENRRIIDRRDKIKK